jgi:ABC-2 type transport system permease protein
LPFADEHSTSSRARAARIRGTILPPPSGPMRYLRLLALQVRLSLAVGLQYRWNFVVDGVVSLLWTTLGLIPLYVALNDRPPVQGWTFERALVVVGYFTLLRGVLDGAVNPSLTAVVDQIRQGTLDFVLLKPADAQFLVSTTRFEPWKALDVVAAVGILTWAFRKLGQPPSLPGAALSLLLLVCALMVLYSLWILVISAAFWVVRLDNLAFFFGSVIDFARWPVGLFKGVWRGALHLFFTFVIPIGLMTTYPAQALLGGLDPGAGGLAPRTAVLAALGSVAFTAMARWVWTRAIARYTSASS